MKKVWISLHRADPVNHQAQYELAYQGYQRIPVESTGWETICDPFNPPLLINLYPIKFAEFNGRGKIAVTHFGIGTRKTGKGRLIASASLEPSALVTDGVVWCFAKGDLKVEVL